MVGIGVVIGAILVGSGLDLFLNLPGFFIVVGGTLAATFVKFPLQNVFSAFKIGASTALKNVHEDPPTAESVLENEITPEAGGADASQNIYGTGAGARERPPSILE